MWLDNPKTRSLPYNPPRIHKYPLSAPDGKLQSIVDSLSTLPNGSFSPDPSGKPIHDLYDAQKLPVTTTSPDSSRSILEILHTPGHTSDSICLYYPPDCSLFTADTVLGHGSSVFEVLGIYMASLRKIIAFGENGEKYGPVYPGHGPVVSNGLGQVTTYLKHRVARETQILEVIQKPPPSNRYWTTWSIVSSIYADYPRDLWEAAARSVDMHLHKLESDGLVEGQGGEGKHTEWNFIG
ncbi:uncharacterized protein FIBRA_08013 [Fibroporia radiculosa]|uniref:Uncharacterized protein n=1 Tax=Fibroporia radiculosa TaxID=599839 RepID=J4GW12_9APHY|nr:uncharacterized protein FIBRA_08013 [Fibroporia radiculosa]CCM05780.1 predicted protein [Fibroporia radiculosa]